ncbi:MAG: DUF6273 domain-containing protein [Treponemataceae bacterium]|nr:DUF6273 domain-containing protein [Treponemataceae bacterium]
MKNSLCKPFLILCLSLFLSVFFISCPHPSGPADGEPVPPTPTTTISPSYFWGTWIRSDTGAQYIVSEHAVSDGATNAPITATTESSLTSSFGTMSKQTENVAEINGLLLFRKIGRNIEYSLNLVSFSSTSNGSGVQALAGQTVTAVSTVYPSYTETATTDQNGKVTLHSPVAGTELTVTVTTAAGDRATAAVTPKIRGEHVGTLAVAPQGMYTLKVSGEISGTQADDGYLYAGNTYNMKVFVENTTNIVAETSVITITSDDERITIDGGTKQDFIISSIARPDKAQRSITLDITKSNFTEPYIDTFLNVEIEDYRHNVWNDTIPLRIFREKLSINVYAENPEKNLTAKLNGFALYPDGNSQRFSVVHNTKESVQVPSFSIDDPLLLSFFGASSSGHIETGNEMEYSFAVNKEPTVNFNSLDKRTVLFYGEDNDTENDSWELEYGEKADAYITENDIDFYTITVTDVHKHENHWSSDETYHWKQALCGHTDEQQLYKAAHTFGSWTTRNAAGDRFRTCSVCKYVAVDHLHQYATSWTSDTDYHWHAATCVHADEKSGKTKHTFGSWSSPDRNGTCTRTCTVCGKAETKHEHVFTAEWTYSETEHWHQATCGHSTEKSGTATHTYGLNEWELITAAGCVTEGVKRQKCDTCSYYRTESIPATGHAFADTWSFDDDNHWHGATCGHSGEKSDIAVHVMGEWSAPDDGGTCIRTCTVCGKPETKHEHVYSSEWTYDETYHWHAAICEHSSEKTDTAAHSFGNWQTVTSATCGTTGSKNRTCSVCGYVETGVISATGNHSYGSWVTVTAATCLDSGKKERVCSVCKKVETGTISATGHSYSTKWTSDNTYHWHAATCEHSTVVNSKATHSFGSWQTVTVETCTTDGGKKRICSVCGAQEMGIIPAGHKETVGTMNETTVTFVCSVCGTVLRTMNRTSLEYLGAYKVLTESELTTYGITSSSIPAKISGATYVKFGVYPQTIKAASVIVDERVVNPEITGAKYYLGSDGNWYARVKENGYCTGSSSSNSQYRYSNGDYVQKSSGGRTLYFKVEPIIWRVLDSSKGLLFAERLLTANVPYYDDSIRRTSNGKTIYANNYAYSNIRAWLNGIDNQFVTDGGTRNSYTIDWTDKGFLQQAFTASQQAKIQISTVDNSARSTSDAGNNLKQATSYYCENTQDKIFLLSEQEVTTTDYGFASSSSYGTGNTRIRKTTDYALANYAKQSSTGYGGVWWWLRSPDDNDDFVYYVRGVFYDGDADSLGGVDDKGHGVVPALLVTESN